MRPLRAALTIALAALPVVVAATPAHAQFCPILNDHVGDAHYLATVPLTDSQVDIVTVNVASGPATVAVEMRVASLDPDLFTNLGPEWVVAWDIDGTGYAVDLRLTFDGPLERQSISRFRVDDTVVDGSVPFVLDHVNDTITWTIPRGLLPDLATPGATFTNFRSFTYLLSSTTDVAANFWMTYVDQTAGCIPAS